MFFVKLSLDVDDETKTTFHVAHDETNMTTVLGKRQPCPVILGKRAIQEITILNDDSQYPNRKSYDGLKSLSVYR